ncbi:hypothetical protein CBM2626_B10117 [Cupriavidus taiwanensis]|nr:hypothetical protein CBM2626_B10117 [Cupriavidus taiwanensis]
MCATQRKNPAPAGFFVFCRSIAVLPLPFPFAHPLSSLSRASP